MKQWIRKMLLFWAAGYRYIPAGQTGRIDESYIDRTIITISGDACRLCRRCGGPLSGRK